MSNFEIEAHEALVLARATLEKSEKNLADAKQFHDAVLKSNHHMASALAILLPKAITPEMPNGEDELTIHEKQAVNILNALSKRGYMDVLYSIQLLAMANADVVDIDVELRTRNNVIEIGVHKIVESEYSRDHKVFGLHMYVDHQADEEARNKLLSAESQIIKIIAQLREEGNKA